MSDSSKFPDGSGVRFVRWIGNNPPLRGDKLPPFPPGSPARMTPVFEIAREREKKRKQESVRNKWEKEDFSEDWEQWESRNVVDVDGWSVHDSYNAPVSVVPAAIDGDVILGDITDEKGKQTGEEVIVGQKDLYTGSLLIGSPGSGKSSEIVNILCQQAKSGDSIICFDPHGELIDDLVKRIDESRVKDIFVLDLQERKFPFSANIFASAAGRNDDAKEDIKNLVLDVFSDIWASTEGGIYFHKFLRNVVGVMMERNDLVLDHVPQFLTDDRFRQACLVGVKDRKVRRFWEEYEELSKSKKEVQTAPFLERVENLLDDRFVHGILNQPGRCIDFREAIEKRRIILVKLPMNKANTARAAKIVGTVLMALVYFAIFSFDDLGKGKSPGVTVAVDEWYNFALSGEKFEKLLREARKYGCKLLLANQGLDQLRKPSFEGVKEAVLDSNILMAFRVGEATAKQLEKVFPGLRVRPKNFYPDPIDRMDRLHVNQDTEAIYHFYNRYITKLLNAEKRRVKEGSTVDDNYKRKRVIIGQLQLFDFGLGDGHVSFDPDDVKILLGKLNGLFLAVQRNGVVDEQRKRLLVTDWLWLARGVEAKEDYERRLSVVERTAIQTVREKLTRLKREKEEKEKLYLDDFNDTSRKVQSDFVGIRVSFEDKIEKAEEELKEVKERFDSLPIYLNGMSDLHFRMGDKWLSDLKEEALKNERFWRRGELMEAWRLWEVKKDLYFEIEGIEHYISEAKKEFARRKEKVSSYLSGVQETQASKLREIDSKIWECESCISDYWAAVDGNAKMFGAEKTSFEAAFDTMLAALIANPLADNDGVSVADVLKTFDCSKKDTPRRALVRVGGVSWFMQTKNMNEKNDKVPDSDYDRRVAEIEKRTRRVYCMDRDVIQREIEAVYSADGEYDSGSFVDVPEKPSGGDSGGAGTAPATGGSGGRKGKAKQVVFDMDASQLPEDSDW